MPRVACGGAGLCPPCVCGRRGGMGLPGARSALPGTAPGVGLGVEVTEDGGGGFGPAVCPGADGGDTCGGEGIVTEHGVGGAGGFEPELGGGGAAYVSAGAGGGDDGGSEVPPGGLAGGGGVVSACGGVGSEEVGEDAGHVNGPGGLTYLVGDDGQGFAGVGAFGDGSGEAPASGAVEPGGADDVGTGVEGS